MGAKQYVRVGQDEIENWHISLEKARGNLMNAVENLRRTDEKVVLSWLEDARFYLDHCRSKLPPRQPELPLE